MNKAIIDLGTNTFNLLISSIENNKLNIIHSEKIGVSLGMGGINSNIIAFDAIDRAIDALSKFKSRCDDYNISKIFAFGTSAIRDAKNNQYFIQQVKLKTGIEVQIINGEKEAELIFKGVERTIDIPNYVIMDIGGGSTEFIFVENEKILDAKSFNIGISRIYQHFENFSDPLNAENVLEIENWLEINTNNYFKNKSEPILVGASGTFETFFELIENTSFDEKSKAIKLDKEKMLGILDELIFSTEEQRKKNHLLIPIRKLMAPIAAIKTRWVINQLKVDEIYVSPFSLKEGAFFEL